MNSNAGMGAAGRLRWFGYLVLATQTFFGAWFLIHGLNYFLEFFRQPPGGSGLSHEFIGIMIKSGLFAWIKAIEVLIGLLLLSHRFVPLAVVAAFPITLVIVYVNFFMNRDTFGVVAGSVTLAANTLLASGYLEAYSSMLAYKAGLPSARGVLNALSH